MEPGVDLTAHEFGDVINRRESDIPDFDFNDFGPTGDHSVWSARSRPIRGRILPVLWTDLNNLCRKQEVVESKRLVSV